ncbi:MAG: hypothetical protein A2431_02205 [Candidatus Zambryskibacteria bacterium RIFOXYC1_FULL_39_10]|uniref:Uncharacterized protein n=1 Tax=Candidatus Zambryskibacteria bacterium RIFOXYC1_FULL_39_10 TaxID=1802779 RepID=A0A1G2V3K3_9BACT|nr:MAG: hypothetical protein A2431_02205 [Candidatus Zambryskibacteria bacterium RIFOXYC1_FULL_39_10]OHB16729.1 MAG: hypothetical protein A2605_01055 [Candidatus Zambryskibacteria bacterium RIFOXYD1_FULL_39_35]
MFEKFFNKPKSEQVPEPLIPNFLEDPEVQDIVSRCATARRNAFAYVHDGQLDKAAEYDKEVREIIVENEEKLKTYLSPYIDLGSDGLNRYTSGTENDRRQVASLLMIFDKEKNAENK